MTLPPKFALAYTRTARAETGHPNESIIRQKEAIYEYGQANGYKIVTYVEHVNRSGRNYDFDWLTEILANDRSIRHVLIYSFDRFSRNFSVTNELKMHLEEKYNVTIDTVSKFHACSLIKLFH